MAQADWGLKRICHSCGTKFYDFHKAEIVCPDCGEIFDPEALLIGKSRIAAKEEEVADELEPTAAVENQEADATDDEASATKEFDLEDEVELGDTSDDTILQDDEDDMDSVDLGVETFSDNEDEDDS